MSSTRKSVSRQDLDCRLKPTGPSSVCGRSASRWAEMSAMVAILGCSRAPAIRFAADQTRPTSLERVLRCMVDLGGLTREMLTDRDPVFCIGATSDGSAILAPEWVDLCTLLGVVPRACRPYRAKTKGKVEPMIRELTEDSLR